MGRVGGAGARRDLWRLATGALDLLDAPVVVVRVVISHINFAMVASIVSFALVYPAVRATRRQKHALMILAATLLVLVITYNVVLRPWDEGMSDLRRLMWRMLWPSAWLGAMLLLGYRWLTSTAGAYRGQLLWAVAPIAFYGMHDGFAQILPPMLGIRGWDPLMMPGFLLSVLAAAVALAICGAAFWQLLRGSASRDERVLALVSPYLLAVSLIQALYPDFGTAGRIHDLVDFLAVLIIVYGVLRFNVVGLDLKLKWGVRQSTIAAAFVAGFFVASELTKVFLSDTLGTYAGVAVLGILVFALAPLRRFADAVTRRLFPRT
jgi:hypothetical protein